MSEITRASQEQTTGIEQVNQAIGQMDQVTQQNAALVEEAAAAAESLQDQAVKLAAIVSTFKIDQLAAAPVVKSAAVMVIPKRPAISPSTRTRASHQVRVAGGQPLASGDDWEQF